MQKFDLIVIGTGPAGEKAAGYPNKHKNFGNIRKWMMKKLWKISLFAWLFFLCIEVRAVGLPPREEAAQAVVQILLNQPESIEDWSDERVYIFPENLHVTKNGVFVCQSHSHIKIPFFAIDDKGVFLECSQKEAQEHYDRAWEAFKDAVGHSLASGAAIAIDQPVIGVFEGYRAVEKWKEFGKEYSSGVDSERTGTICGSEDSKD